MTRELELSIINDLIGSGADDTEHAVTPEEIAQGVKESEEEVKNKLSTLASYNCVPIEEVEDGLDSERYMLEGIEEAREYRDDEFGDPRSPGRGI